MRPAPRSTGRGSGSRAGCAVEIVQATAPAIYTQHARNPERNVQIGGDATVFAPNYGSPFVHDLDDGRRYATLADFENFVKLAYMSPYLHHSGGTVCEPVDVPVSKRHLDMVYAHLRYSDKPFMGRSPPASERADSVEMARIAFGGDLDDRTVMTSLINASSPLVWDADDARSRRGLRRGQPGVHHHPVHPRRRDGTGDVGRRRGPDARRGARRHDLHAARPPGRAGGVRIVRQLDVDADRRADVRHPRTGDRALHRGALARRLGVPFRSGGSLCASKLPDAQAAYESRSDAAADRDGRRELRAARRRLARGRAGDRLREVRARRRPTRR